MIMIKQIETLHASHSRRFSVFVTRINPGITFCSASVSGSFLRAALEHTRSERFLINPGVTFRSAFVSGSALQAALEPT